MKNQSTYLRLVSIVGIFTLFFVKIYNLWYYLPFLILSIYLAYSDSKKSKDKASFVLAAVAVALFIGVIVIFRFFM